MVREHNINSGWPPIGAPLLNVQRDEYDQHWSSFDSSVNAVSFGFVATAILVSMFLVMAIFERFLKPTSPPILPSGGRNRRRSSQMDFNGKLGHPSPKVHLYLSNLAVLLEGTNLIGTLPVELHKSGVLFIVYANDATQTLKDHMSLYASWVSVLMPGDATPSFIAHPVPAPCCPERISWPSHQHSTLPYSTYNTMPSINQV
ncbi:hypothetical protein JHK87_037136 [Glycine soja]|nr:hypothetical protein JHK87_037136 [Glycine soja]